MIASSSPLSSAVRALSRAVAPLCVAALLISLGSNAPAIAAGEAPYSLEKFRPVLDDSKLQAPTSSPTLINPGKFDGASNEFFHLDETGQYLVFTATGKSNRSELRQMTGDWQTSTATEQRLTARVRVPLPESENMNQFTFLQIHDKEENGRGLNKPLIRVVWYSDRKGVTDHLWAAIRTPKDPTQPISNDNLDSKWEDLGPRPTGFFDAVISVQNNQMKVTIDGETKLDMDVAYWDGLQNYFKAGVYNQGEGTAFVEFEELRYGSQQSE